MTNRSDRRSDTPIISAAASRCRLTDGNRTRGFHQGQSKHLLANRPVIVPQSILFASALQYRGSPYSLVERRASARPLELKLCSFATRGPFPCSIRGEGHSSRGPVY